MVETHLLRALSLIWLSVVVVALAPAILEALTESVTETTVEVQMPMILFGIRVPRLVHRHPSCLH
ncbi:MAG: hypothetical protein ACJZ59_07290 [Candidatus Thalassarchaeaceae archaeon]